MGNAPTKEVQTILSMVDLARKSGLSLPEAVDAYRSELRAAMRSHARSARVFRERGRCRMAEQLDCMRARLRRESARARRLQLRFASWRQTPLRGA